MGLAKASCYHCGAIVDIDTDKEVHTCPYCGATFKITKKVEDPKPVQEQKADSPVVAICHDCGRGIKANETVERYERHWETYGGRGRGMVKHSETYPLCPHCYKKQIDADEAEEKARLAEIAREKEHESHVKTFWVIFGLVVIIAICCFFGYVATTMGMNFFAGFGIGFVVLVIAFLVLLFKVIF